MSSRSILVRRVLPIFDEYGTLSGLYGQSCQLQFGCQKFPAKTLFLVIARYDKEQHRRKGASGTHVG